MNQVMRRSIRGILVVALAAGLVAPSVSASAAPIRISFHTSLLGVAFDPGFAATGAPTPDGGLRIDAVAVGLLASNEYFFAFTRKDCSSTGGKPMRGATPFTTEPDGSAHVEVAKDATLDWNSILQRAASAVIYVENAAADTQTWSACRPLERHVVSFTNTTFDDEAAAEVLAPLAGGGGTARPALASGLRATSAVFEADGGVYVRTYVGSANGGVWKLALTRASCAAGEGRVSRRPVRFTVAEDGTAAVGTFLDGVSGGVWSRASHRAKSIVIFGGSGDDVVQFAACGSVSRYKLEDVLVSS